MVHDKPCLMVAVPAFNEDKMIGKILSSIPGTINGIGKILVVVIDDGSSDDTLKVAKKHRVIVLRHLINRGLGGVLGTAFKFAKKNKIDILVTLDADGQHKPSDIKHLIRAIINKQADVVVGSRLLKKSSMPLSRRLINIMSNIATWIFFGIWSSDSQSGFRAFSKKAINCIELRTQRMEVSSEIFKEIKRNKLKIAEVPIKAIYTHYSLTKGQKISNAAAVVTKLFIRSMS